MKFILGSASEVKKEILEKALQELYLKPDIEAVGADSEITDQPLDKDATLMGSKNRARNAKKGNPDADFWIGLEGGLHDYGEGYHLVTYACLLDSKENEFIGSGTEIALPQAVTQRVEKGELFGQAIREYAKSHAIDENLVSREVPFTQAIQNAYVNYLKATGKLTYRRKASAVVVNKQNKILLLQLQSYGENDWNIPGGGREVGETAEQNIKRELAEELGTDKFEILEKSEIVNKYDFPDFVIARLIREKKQYYKGQRQTQFIVRFTGDDKDIKPQEKEIRKYKWVEYKDLQSFLRFPGQWENVERVIKSTNKLKRLI